MASEAAKRPREEGRQYVEKKDDKSEEKIVKNSPYGSTRAPLGWGTPFKAAPKCTVNGYPNLRIGLSSLNATPSKDRDMAKLMQIYMKKFSCLEHCNPYHRMGEPQNWTSWHSMPGKRDFCFTVKANQYLTHTRMLEVDEDTSNHIDNFFRIRCKEIMSDRLGAVLVQLPPQFKLSPGHLERLKGIGALIPEGVRVAVEFRHRSWFTSEVYEVLRQIKWGLVVTHNEDVGESPVVDTGVDFMYVRLHGAVERYAGDYGPLEMNRWADRVAEFTRGRPDRHVFFFLNNNESSAAGLTSSVADATYLAQRLGEILKEGSVAAPAAAATPAPPAVAPLAAPLAASAERGPERPSGPRDASEKKEQVFEIID